MSVRESLVAAGFIGLAGVMSCDSGGVDAGPSFLFVRGVVTAPDGSGVAGAGLLLEVRVSGEPVPIGREPTTADATGHYEVLLGVFVPPFDGLLSVYATPPDTTVLRPGSVVDRSVRFNPPESRDTVRVNVSLEAT